MSDDETRAERLRSRRRSTRASAGADQDNSTASDSKSEPDKQSGTDDSSQTSKTSKPDKQQEGGGVKDEQVGTYMYLPESLKDELAYQFKIQSAEYEREFGDEFEKNRHWYPLVVSLGLAAVEEMSPEELRSALDENVS